MLNPQGNRLLATLFGVLSLLSCSPRKDEIVGILKPSPSYNASVAHKHLFGKFLLQDVSGRVYALREGQGFHVLDFTGRLLSDGNREYPVYFGCEYRLIGRTIKIAEAKRILTVGNPSELWYPPEANALFDVETMIVKKLP